MFAHQNLATAGDPFGSGARHLEATMAVGFLSVDGEGRLVDCNEGAERLFGRRRKDMIGHPSWEVAGLAPKTSFGALVRKVAARRTPEDAELLVRNERGERLFAVHAVPAGDGVEVEWNDITAARTAELRLALSEARYQEASDGAPPAAWLSRADGALIYISQSLVDTLGRPRRELLGHGWIAAMLPEERADFLARRAAARADHSSVECEARFRRSDGTVRTVQLFGRPRFGFLGEFCGHVGLARDVSGARESEAREAALANELNHRVKNTLATVQSLVRHTLREHGVARAAERAVIDRLMALSAAHNVLSRDAWTGADLADLVRELVQDHKSRISVAGPDVRVSPRSAIALAMALQELAANALAHRALSKGDGLVELVWTTDAERVALEWRETGSATAAPPSSGFGGFLLGRMLAADLGAPAEIVHAPTGLICRMSAPVLQAPDWRTPAPQNGLPTNT